MNSFFRHIFFFTKSQKRGLIVLILLLILVIVANVLIAKYLRKAKPLYSDDSVFLSQVDSFKNSLSDKGYYKYDNTYSPADFAEARYDEANRAVRLYYFDPNTLDSAGFVALGLKPFIAKNIVNYRKKGGKFRLVDDFARVYGLLPADFARLKPYIRIADTKDDKSDVRTAQPADKQTENVSKKTENNIVVELNTADTVTLKQLPGIGSYYARQIVYYRNKLGGYYSVNQLLEIKNFPVQTFEKIKNNLTVAPALIKKINVNWATVEKLNSHPYLNFYQSKAIFELRKKKKLQSIDDFRQISDFSDEDLKKIENYLLFK